MADIFFFVFFRRDLLAVEEEASSPSATCSTKTFGMFEIAVSPSSVTSETANGALRAGSSKHGKAIRAEFASNCVTAAARRTEGEVSRRVGLFASSFFSSSVASLSSVQVLR